MALTTDQRALLKLVLEKGQGYGQIATLLGVEEAEVRERARRALSELGGADPDRGAPLTDFLLGQADPIDRADAIRHLREQPDDHRLAGELADRLRELYPTAQLPRLPGEPREGRRIPALRRGAARKPRERKRRELSSSQTRTIAILAGAGVLVVAIVLALTGVFSGEDESSPETASTPAPAEEEIACIPLEATAGGDASGQAVVGLASADQPYVDVTLEGLDPAPGGRTYVIWMLIDETRGYPLAPISASQQGSFNDRFAIPSAVLPLITQVQFVDISIAPDEELARLIARAQRQAQEGARLEDFLLERPGETVLRGAVPSGDEVSC